MKSLVEIEKAIARLPKKSQQQLVRDMPALCPKAFPLDTWDAILADATPRPGLSSLLDQLDAIFHSQGDNAWAHEAKSRLDAFEAGKLQVVSAATVLVYREKSRNSVSGHLALPRVARA